MGRYENGRFLYHRTCPFHAGDNEASLAFYSNGSYYCFACGAYGRSADLGAAAPSGLDLERQKHRRQRVRHLYRELMALTYCDFFERGQVSWRLYDELHHNLQREPARYNYWLGRGLLPHTIASYRLGWTGSWYAIPILRWGQPYSLRFRRDEADPFVMKYMILRGSSPTLFNTRCLMEAERVFVVEGEVDALSLAQYGLPAVSLTGGINAWDAYWLKQLGRPALILFDNDAAGQQAAHKLCALGAERAHLPSAYKDVNEALLSMGAEWFRAYFGQQYEGKSVNERRYLAQVS